MTVGQKIKKYRIEKKLTQKDLADLLHVTFQTVSKWEKDENEPDIQTLRELAKIFECSLDSLLNEEDVVKEENNDSEPTSNKPATQTIIVHQKELHVCERCKKDIAPTDLEIEEVLVRPRRRGRAAVYRQAYYHRKCLATLNAERQAAEDKEKLEKIKKIKKRCFGWGIFGGVVAFIIALVSFLLNTQYIHPALGVFLSVLIGYSIFSMLYCILCGSYIGDVFFWCAGVSIKFPGIIFTWDLDGIAFLVVMKIFFAILAFSLGIFALAFAICFSALLGGISFPFILIHNNKTNYEDAL